jgi:carboxyl-terminal processing protease
MVVLIDAETASGAEVVAGAIKDHHRGVIVGQRSAGKGSMQHVFPLTLPAARLGSAVGDGAAALRLTTAKLFSPLDNPYTDHGVLPDIVVDHVPDMGDPSSMMGVLQLQRHQFETALHAARELAAKPGNP